MLKVGADLEFISCTHLWSQRLQGGLGSPQSRGGQQCRGALVVAAVDIHGGLVLGGHESQQLVLGLRGVRVVTDYHSPQEERRDLFAQHEQVPQHPHDESLLLGQNGPLNQPAVLPNFCERDET